MRQSAAIVPGRQGKSSRSASSLCYNEGMTHKLLLLSLACLSLALTGAAWGQKPAANAPAMFPFVLPWDDATPGTATDLSFLNAKPAGVNGFIVPKSGHFIESKTGKRVRFLATNLVAKSAFPSHADAEKVAARLAKLGINLVRLHHMDNSNWGQESSIWDYAYKDRQHLSAAQLDKLDDLIAHLKKNGIYVNLNLHVSRQFSDADGFPESVNQISFGFDKRVDEFDRRMIQLQKNYAHDLLTHVNPYTGLSYAADPCVAVVEINNENSLVGDPWATLGADLNTLPEPFRGELAGFWNDWLKRKYGTDAKVQAAWTMGLTPIGPGLLHGDTQWSIEHQGTSQAELSASYTEHVRNNLAADARIDVTQTDGTDWHVQTHQTGLDLHGGHTYTVTFRAKADKERTMPVAAGLDQDDWHNVGLAVNADVGIDWKTFRYVFTAHDTAPNHNRIAFTLGGQTGTVWISDLQIHPGADGAGLAPGQSLAAKTVDIPNSPLKAQQDDWIAFLADTERAYAEEMRAYLKDNLHIHANVICSQISWGGLTGLGREANMDFADNHAYWQHPSFPHKAWDAQDWTVQNTPMVSDLADGKGGTLRDLAEYRVAGKPYSVSEYNHPAPNDYRAETLPLLATFAAFQDWDAIYLFDYGEYGAGAQNDKINGFFGIGSDPAKTAFLPAAAMIFRASEIGRAHNTAITVVPKNQWIASQSVGGVRGATARRDAVFSAFQVAFGLTPGENAFSPISSKMFPISSKMFPPFSVLAVSKTRTGALYTASASAAQALTGYVGGQTVTLGTNTLTFPAFGNNFAAVTLTAMDQKPLPQSRRLLLTLVGKVENQDMVWNAARTSVGNQWGHGPTVAEGIPATITLKTDSARHVWALDGTGKRVGSVPSVYAGGSLTFTVGPQYKTLWYEIGE